MLIYAYLFFSRFVVMLVCLSMLHIENLLFYRLLVTYQGDAQSTLEEARKL
jgi:hypothetical protein